MATFQLEQSGRQIQNILNSVTTYDYVINNGDNSEIFGNIAYDMAELAWEPTPLKKIVKFNNVFDYNIKNLFESMDTETFIYYTNCTVSGLYFNLELHCNAYSTYQQESIDYVTNMPVFFTVSTETDAETGDSRMVVSDLIVPETTVDAQYKLVSGTMEFGYDPTLITPFTGYWGLLPSNVTRNNVTESDILNLSNSKDIWNSGETLSFPSSEELDNQHCCFAYPATLGKLKYIYITNPESNEIRSWTDNTYGDNALELIINGTLYYVYVKLDWLADAENYNFGWMNL